MRLLAVRFACLACLACAAVAAEQAADDGPQLTVTESDAGLTITTEVRANNSPHLVTTRHDLDDRGRLRLDYVLWQNRDLYRRSIKTVTVTWTVPGLARADVTEMHARGDQVAVNTADYRQLFAAGERLLPPEEEKGP